jgi:hypothetical protein
VANIQIQQIEQKIERLQTQLEYLKKVEVLKQNQEKLNKKDQNLE